MTAKDQAVLVTGANRGIGQALVAEALARGAKRVYAASRQPLAHPDDRVTPLTLDVTSATQILDAARQVESLDMLINNAGIMQRDDLSDPAVLERHLAVNLFGTYDIEGADPGEADYAIAMRAVCALAGLTFTLDDLRRIPLVGTPFG